MAGLPLPVSVKSAPHHDWSGLFTTYSVLPSLVTVSRDGSTPTGIGVCAAWVAVSTGTTSSLKPSAAYAVAPSGVTAMAVTSLSGLTLIGAPAVLLAVLTGNTSPAR